MDASTEFDVKALAWVFGSIATVVPNIMAVRCWPILLRRLSLRVLGVSAFADLSEGGLSLAHVVELVLTVAITTNWVQYSWHRCTRRLPASGHFSRFAPFYVSILATLLLCFPKADVVVGDLIPSWEYEPALKQYSAMLGTLLCLASEALLLVKPPSQYESSKEIALLGSKDTSADCPYHGA